MDLIKFLLRTQVFAITIGLLRIIYLDILAFLDQPERALQYINWFVYGLAIVVSILVFFLTRYFIGKRWLAILLVLICYLIIYEPIFLNLQSALLNQTSGYNQIIKFLAISTGLIYFGINAFGMVLGYWFGAVKRD